MKIYLLIIMMIFISSCNIYIPEKKCIEWGIRLESAYRYDCGPSIGFNGGFRMACGYRNFLSPKEVKVCKKWIEINK